MNLTAIAISLPLSFAALFQNVNVDQLKYALFLGPDPDLQQEVFVEDTGFLGEASLTPDSGYETTSFSGELSEQDMTVIMNTAYPNGGLYSRLPNRQGYTDYTDYYVYSGKVIAIQYNQQGKAVGYNIGY